MNLDRFLIIGLLGLGIILRLVLTSNGNFLFNLDSARDMVDVREMVELHKFRLTGPTSGIDGVYDGPAWYYLMAIPYILSAGDPYSMILMEIIFWAIGGWFLLKIVSRYGRNMIVLVGILWIFSDLTFLATRYSLSPNLVLLLFPVLFYVLEKSLNLKTKKVYLYTILVWGLAGFIFNLEMAFGLVVPILLLFIYWLYDHKFYLRLANYFGVVVYGLFLLPQIIFDLKHQNMMGQALVNYLHQPGGGSARSNLINLWRETVSGILLNNHFLIDLSWVLVVLTVVIIIKKLKLSDKYLIISLVFFLGPLLIYFLIPINIMLWHLLSLSVGFLILMAGGLGQLKKGQIGRLLGGLLIVISGYFGIVGFLDNLNQLSNDVSLFKNESAAIDYVYASANHQNFKAYVYMPSVIDYPYQYLFWWQGIKKYGYTPSDYAYLPNKPAYISSQQSFIKLSSGGASDRVYLIKEPDRIYMRQAWENSFNDLPVVETVMVGPLEVEIRQDLSQMNASATLEMNL